MIHTLGKEKPYQAPEDYLQKAVARLIWAQYSKSSLVSCPQWWI